MRVGVMIGAERGDMTRKVDKLASDIEWAESAGLDTAWMPQVPNDFDCLTMVSLMAGHSSRIELGTAVVPLQAVYVVGKDGVALRQVRTGDREADRVEILTGLDDGERIAGDPAAAARWLVAHRRGKSP